MVTINKIGRTVANRKFSVILLFAAAVLFSPSTFGQMKIRVGATAGLNVASLYQKGMEFDIKSGFRGGAVVDIGLAKIFSVVPEVLFSQRGWKLVGKDDMEGMKQTASVNYVEVPVNLTLKIPVAADTKITLFPGFYAAYALSGKVKNEAGGVSETTKVPLGKGIDDMNPLDMGLNLGLGLEIKSVFFRFQLHSGFKNLDNDKEDNAILNSAFSLSLGYFIK